MGNLEWPYPTEDNKAFVELICDVIDISINHPDNRFTERPDITAFRSNLQEFKHHVIDSDSDTLHIPEHLTEAFVSAILILNKLLTDPQKDADIIRTALFDSGFKFDDFIFIQKDILLMISNQFPSNEDIQYAYVKTLLISEELDTVNTGMP